MIRSFNCTETERIWNGQVSRAFPPDIQNRARQKLRALNRAVVIEDLRTPPGNHLETLSGNLAGKWSIRVNDQWRVVFDWSDGGAENVEIRDYH